MRISDWSSDVCSSDLIARFRDFVRQEGLDNVEPFVDVAHAALSSNLFNRKRVAYSSLRDDPRFAWISEEDLQEVEWLHPFDFVDSDMPYLHASDAILLDRSEERRVGEECISTGR